MEACPRAWLLCVPQELRNHTPPHSGETGKSGPKPDHGWTQSLPGASLASRAPPPSLLSLVPASRPHPRPREFSAGYLAKDVHTTVARELWICPELCLHYSPCRREPGHTMGSHIEEEKVPSSSYSAPILESWNSKLLSCEPHQEQIRWNFTFLQEERNWKQPSVHANHLCRPSVPLSSGISSFCVKPKIKIKNGVCLGFHISTWIASSCLMVLEIPKHLAINLHLRFLLKTQSQEMSRITFPGGCTSTALQGHYHLVFFVLLQQYHRVDDLFQKETYFSELWK